MCYTLTVDTTRTFCQELINLYQNEMPLITLQLKDNRTGVANYGRNVLTIPLWLFESSKKYWNNRSLEYRYYYVLHEISHFINYHTYNATGHQGTFRTVERRLLLDFGLIPVYKRAYVKQLLSENGDVLYSKK